MKVKKLGKLISRGIRINVYCDGNFIDQGEKDKIIDRYSNHKIDGLSAGHIEGKDGIAPVIRLFLK